MQKIIVRRILIFLVFSFIGSGIAFSQNDAYFKAMNYLEQKGEVNFSFQISSKTELETLSRIVSIDKVENLIVFAYANGKSFEKFLLLGYSYKVLQPPGELFDQKKNILKNAEEAAEDYDYTYYPTYEQYANEIMPLFEDSNYEICKIIDRGTSVDGRKILFAKISSNINDSENKPRIMFVSTMHGNETAGYVIMLRFINYLLKNYYHDSEITSIMDNFEIWINPLLNPDGTYTDDNSTVQDAIRFNAASEDLNRNFPDFISGEHPDEAQTQPETQAIISLLDEYEFVISANIHAGVECVAYPWFTTSTAHDDEDWFIDVSTKYANLAKQNSPEDDDYFNDWGGVTNGNVIPASGTISDYLSYYHNCRDITIELSKEKILPEDQLNDIWDYNYPSLLNYLNEIYNLVCVDEINISNSLSGGTYNFQANRSITSSNAIFNEAKVNFSANNSIKLTTGFKVEKGSRFFADLKGCTEVSTELTNDYVEPYEVFSIENQSEEIKLCLTDGVLLYPNPTKGLLTIATDNAELKHIVIYNILGALVYSSESVNRNIVIDLSAMYGGIYIAKIVQSNATVNKQFVIE